MRPSHLLPGLSAIMSTLAAPTDPTPSGGSVCDATSTLQDNGYTVMANNWGSGSGHQCASTQGGQQGQVAWSTTWDWQAGDGGVKSFANAYSPGTTPCQTLNQIESIHTTWKWNYQINSPIKADVSYDMFLSTSGGGCTTVGNHDYEVMVWLAAYGGLIPINENGIVGQFAYNGVNYDIYKGNNYPNGVNTVYSFYPSGGKVITNFEGDLVPFLKKLEGLDGGIGGAKLQSVQAGTEPVGGSATFVVSEYSIGG